jgi:hypothetical protein
MKRQYLWTCLMAVVALIGAVVGRGAFRAKRFGSANTGLTPGSDTANPVRRDPGAYEPSLRALTQGIDTDLPGVPSDVPQEGFSKTEDPSEPATIETTPVPATSARSELHLSAMNPHSSANATSTIVIEKPGLANRQTIGLSKAAADPKGMPAAPLPRPVSAWANARGFPPLQRQDQPERRTRVRLFPGRRVRYARRRRARRVHRAVDLVCRRYGMRWRILAEIQDDPPRVLYQGHTELSRVGDRLWQVRSLTEPFHSGRRLWLTEFRKQVWLFRVFGDEGRRVERPNGDGLYLVVVPHDWHVAQNGQLCQFQAMATEGWSGFMVDGLIGVVVENPEGRRVWEFEAPLDPVRISGTRATELHTPIPLFIGRPPELWARWDIISTVVVGLEGPDAQWVRRVDPPAPGSPLPLEQLPLSVGWYFVRSYDRYGRLADTLSFYYAQGLFGIEVSHHGEQGYTEMIFRHRPGFRVQPVDEPDPAPPRAQRGDDAPPPNDGHRRLVVEAESTETRTRIPFGPRWNCLPWDFADTDGNSVRVTLGLPRIAWAIGPRNAAFEDLEWSQRSKAIPKGCLRPSSAETIFIAVYPGISRVYEVRVDNTQPVSIALRQGIGTCPLHTWSAFHSRAGSFEIVLFTRDSPENLYRLGTVVDVWVCKVCRYRADSEDTVVRHVRENHPVAYTDVKDWTTYRDEARLQAMLELLPQRVYQCVYCGTMLADDGLRNLNDAMAEHQQQNHRSPEGVTKLDFRTIDNVDEVRRVIQQNLPPMRICRQCGRTLLLDRLEVWECHVNQHAVERAERE